MNGAGKPWLGAAAGVVLVPWAVWVLVRLTGWDTVYPLPIIMAFTPYAGLTSLVPLLVALALRRRVVAGVAALVVIGFAVVLVPRGLGGPNAPVSSVHGPRLVVMASNLRLGMGDAEAVVALVRRYRVDVLCLEELTAEAVGRLDAAGIRARLPGRVLETYTGGGGGGVMARWPDLRYAGHQEPSGPAQPEAGASVPGVGRLNVKAVHPFVPTSRSGVRQWRAQLGRLPAAMEDGVPHILAGDFNATLDHSVVRDAIARGYVDAADAVGAGWKPTFPVAPWGRRRPPITLDHILVPKDWRVRAFSVHTLRGSDHKTVIAELQAP